ncbi:MULTISPECIES: tRNA pseudouridine(65) synthase TruC [unclassified Gilliamella]|uniref:tRNA pseudouridine(65) synthase TruC n=1 Tax=unclassified Gilliamella TaxID=2685620 RepID=UPI00080DCEA6|nr:tRNA pseudouridine(65) synthase TruC [Gilliamella apicola]OCG21178.1 tRNA pseudouridine(65) synthase TruC [Gilliamella apicola]OCG22018.1 tRNA pseudouridine(65) synthase TruC [Gilliamella apicola]
MFEILYQDDVLIAINKPSGWLVHRSWLDKNETVVVMQTLRDQIGQHVFPVHRLDRPTSGVLLFALSSKVARLMSEQFLTKKIEKNYYAIVRGYVEGEAVIDYPLVEELDKIADKFSHKNKSAQDAVTFYRGISKIEVPIKVGKFDTARYSFIELKPKTGRKHQLRRHMKHIFHPILGDSKHGDLHQNRAFTDYFGIKRLMLHASVLKFTHPIEQKQMTINAQLDSSWKNILLKFK